MIHTVVLFGIGKHSLTLGVLTCARSYKITGRDDYYFSHCISVAQSKIGAPLDAAPPSSIADGKAGAYWYCALINQCGWPLGTARQDGACVPLNPYYQSTSAVSGLPHYNIPDDSYTAMCAPYYNAPGVNPDVVNGRIFPACAVHDAYQSIADQLSTDHTEKQEKDWKRPLSFLFNAFIMLQVR